MAESKQGTAYALEGGGGEHHNGIDFTAKAGESGTTNGAALIEYTTRKGEEPGDHTHDTEDEMFYVLGGGHQRTECLTQV
jgi:quercetin dioxygenase-like cupin family protein